MSKQSINVPNSELTFGACIVVKLLITSLIIIRGQKMLQIKKNIVKTLLISVGVSFSIYAIADETDAAKFGVVPPQINATNYILVDYDTGQVLAAKNADERHDPASLTKMMTSYVVGQALKQGRIKNSDIVTITDEAWGKNFPVSSKMFLNLNQKVSVGELNRGMIIASGNDACVALASFVAGSQQNFVNIMNEYVSKLGLTNTHFKTVHGLDTPGQFSTARDMSILATHIIRDLPQEYKIYSEKDFTFNNIKQYNRNRLLWDTSMHVDGMKTGHTDGAGYNLVTSAVEDNTRLISVVLGTDSAKLRESESKKLLQWGFSNFRTLEIMPANHVIAEDKVYYGTQDKVKLGTLKSIYTTVPINSINKLKASYMLNSKTLEAPLTKGQVVGKVTYKLDGKEIATADLQVLEPVAEAGVMGRFGDWISLTLKQLF